MSDFDLTINPNDLDDVLFELRALADCINMGQRPEVSTVIRRCPYLLDFVLNLLAEGTMGSFCCQIMAIDEQGQASHSLLLSEDMRSIAEGPSRETYLATAQTWFTQLQGERLAKTRFSGLPIFEDKPPYDPIPLDFRMYVDTHASHVPDMSELMSQVRNYEHYGPPHGNNGYYRPGLPVRDVLPLLPERLGSDDDFLAWVQDDMPDSHHTIDNPEHRQTAPWAISDWFLRGPFRDISSNVEFGGPGGVRVGVFLITRVIANAARIGKLASRPGNVLSEDAIMIYARSCIKTLTNQMAASQAVLLKTRDERRRSTNTCLSFQEMQTPEAAREDDPIVALIDNNEDNEDPHSDGFSSPRESVEPPPKVSTKKRADNVAAPWEAQVKAAETKMLGSLPASMHKDLGLSSYQQSTAAAPVHSPPPVSEPHAKKQKMERAPRETETAPKKKARPKPRVKSRSRVPSSEDDVEIVDDAPAPSTVSSADEVVVKKEPVQRSTRAGEASTQSGASMKSSISRAPSVIQDSEPERMQVDDADGPEEEDETSFRPPARKASLFSRNDLTPPRALSTPAESREEPKARPSRQKSVPARDASTTPVEAGGTGLPNVRKPAGGAGRGRATRGKGR